MRRSSPSTICSWTSGENDLGKISRFGTVTVERLREILRFSHVMHIGSAVRGEIREDCDALDAIDAVLPAAPSPARRSTARWS